MKINFFFALFISLTTSHLLSTEDVPKVAVTISFSVSRIGDNLLSYFHGKWASYVYDIPFVYKPFNLSNQLLLHDKEKLHFEQTSRKFQKFITAKDSYAIDKILPNKNFNQPTLITIPYFPERSWGGPLEKNCSLKEEGSFYINWDDQNFRKI